MRVEVVDPFKCSLANIVDIIDSNNSCEMNWLAKYTKFVFNSTLEGASSIVKDFAEINPTARDWLEKKGFIRIIKETKTYRVGQKFNHKDYGTFGVYFLGDDLFILLNLITGTRWTNSVKLTSISFNLTENDMQKLTNNRFNEFTVED